MNNRLLIGAMLFMAIAAVLAGVLLFGVNERRAVVAGPDTGLLEADLLCRGELTIEVDRNGSVLATDCVEDQ